MMASSVLRLLKNSEILHHKQFSLCDHLWKQVTSSIFFFEAIVALLIFAQLAMNGLELSSNQPWYEGL